ncbi:MAG: hypothetical protein FWF20_06980 [Betaproteobacteria bacterium]|nr:hypothetical protein [Betaproteobacteria bacterium]MCL2886512.1 hypothetical protein [Betaproteobacteria bacterium]
MADETVTLPDFEIFRAGTHRDRAGGEWDISDADLAAIAAGYKPDFSEAPIVVGHPSVDAPAYGWVTSIHVADGRLYAKSRDVDPAFAEMVKAQRFPKRSAAFYPPQHPSNPTPGQLYLRHVGFLGAHPPAVKGLRDIHFSAADGVISFAEDIAKPSLPASLPQAGERRDLPPLSTSGEGSGVRIGHALSHPSLQENPMSDDNKAKPAPAADPAQTELAALKAQFSEAVGERDNARAELATIKQQLAEIEARGREARHLSHIAFAEAQVAASHILPKDVGAMVAVLDLLADAAPVEFTEGDATRKLSPVEFVKNLIERQQSGLQFGEFAPGKVGGGKPQGDAAIDAAARKLAAEKSIPYADAVRAVVTAGA